MPSSDTRRFLPAWSLASLLSLPDLAGRYTVRHRAVAWVMPPMRVYTVGERGCLALFRMRLGSVMSKWGDSNGEYKLARKWAILRDL